MAVKGPMYRSEGRGQRDWERRHKKNLELERTYEARLRRMAERLGFRLEKSKADDPGARGYDTFQLVHVETGEKITGKAAGPVGRRYLDDDGNYGLLIDRVHNILV